MLARRLLGAGGVSGVAYPSFTVVPIGTYQFDGSVALLATDVDLGPPQADRVLVAGMVQLNGLEAANFEVLLDSISLTRRVSRNGANDSDPGVAMFSHAWPTGQLMDLSWAANGSNRAGVIRLWSVYRAASAVPADTNSAVTSGSSGSYTLSSGGGALFGVVGMRNSSSSIERRGAGGHGLVAAGTRTVNYAETGGTAISGDVTQEFNLELGGTSSNNDLKSCAITIDEA